MHLSARYIERKLSKILILSVILPVKQCGRSTCGTTFRNILVVVAELSSASRDARGGGGDIGGCCLGLSEYIM